MPTTTKLRLAAFASLISITGITFGFVGATSALDKKDGCVSPTSIAVAYGVCR